MEEGANRFSQHLGWVRRQLVGPTLMSLICDFPDAWIWNVLYPTLEVCNFFMGKVWALPGKWLPWEQGVFGPRNDLATDSGTYFSMNISGSGSKGGLHNTHRIGKHTTDRTGKKMWPSTRIYVCYLCYATICYVSPLTKETNQWYLEDNWLLSLCGFLAVILEGWREIAVFFISQL